MSVRRTLIMSSVVKAVPSWTTLRASSTEERPSSLVFVSNRPVDIIANMIKT